MSYQKLKWETLLHWYLKNRVEILKAIGKQLKEEKE